MQAMKRGLSFRCSRSPWSIGPQVDFLGVHVFEDQSVAIAEPLSIKRLDRKDEGLVWTPTFSLDPDSAQLLMDELWNCGLRPSEGSGSAGQLASVQKHLEDMRVIAFSKSGILKNKP